VARPDPDDEAGHRLRAGLAPAAGGGASERNITRQTGPTSRQMIDRSRRDGDRVTVTAATRAGW
jgi:hypothetical protein